MTGGATAAASPGLADRLSSDVLSLIATLRSPWTWLLLGIVIGFLIGAWRLRRLVGQDRRLTPRVRAVATASINALAGVVVAVVVAGFLWSRAPLLLGIALAVLAATAGLGIAIRSRAWMWGLVMIWRGRARIGDRLRFGAIDGTVAEVGIIGITVIGDDGARIFIPNAKLAGDTFSVASPEEVYPAEVTVRRDDRDLTRDDLERLRRIGVLCPYRETSGNVVVTLGPDARSATVAVRSWSEEAARLASDYIAHAFEPERR
jgi:small-conductance mechanosensitive channel